MHQFSLIKKSKKSHKIAEIKVFLTLFVCCWKDPDRDPDPYKIITDPDPGGPIPYESYTAPDPDPQHCIEVTGSHNPGD
jgi:hypothetical protein